MYIMHSSSWKLKVKAAEVLPAVLIESLKLVAVLKVKTVEMEYMIHNYVFISV